MKVRDIGITKELIVSNYRSWCAKLAPAGFRDTEKNAALIGEFIETNKSGQYTHANFTAACNDFYLRNRLDFLTQLETEQQKAERLAAAQKEKDEATQLAAIQFWLVNHCPLGLLTKSTGEPYASDIDKIIEFVRTNYNMRFTVESLNAAVTVLGPTLVWMVPPDSPDRQIRNMPEKLEKKRQISERMAIEAGFKHAVQENPHARDGQFVDPNVKMRKMIQKIIGKTNDPDMQKADAISVNRNGKRDHSATASIRQIIITNADGSPNGKATLAARTAAAENHERQRSRA
jgi:hypothetical protein